MSGCLTASAAWLFLGHKTRPGLARFTRQPGQHLLSGLQLPSVCLLCKAAWQHEHTTPKIYPDRSTTPASVFWRANRDASRRVVAAAAAACYLPRLIAPTRLADGVRWTRW